MKILFVLEHYYPYIGGAEKLFYVLTKALAKDGHKVTVVTTLHDKALLKKELHKGVQIRRLKCWNRFAFTIFSLPTVIRLARYSDLIHTTTYNAALPAIIGGRLTKKPVFITFHEVWGALWKQLPFTSFIWRYGFYYFEQLLLRLPFTRFVAVSDFTKSSLIEHGIQEQKIVRIYNGIDYSRFENLKASPRQTFTFTFFGRLGISKGLDLLIPAASKFKKQFPQSRFKLIIPQQPKGLYKRIISLLKEYKLEDWVDIKHNLSREDLYQELLNSSCVVIPSYSEGFCFAAAEAVALKVPIISSHQGALPEVVSGNFINLEEMSADAITQALIKAYNGNWDNKPLKYFKLSETKEAYRSIYESYFNRATKS
jgi:glycosyltransferase involved in cell wall biosynthesis